MLPGAKFVCRSDVRGYYANIDHERLEKMLDSYVDDPRIMNLVRQYLRRSICRGENYRDIRRGIPLRAPLSPLMGALYLLPLDRAMAKHNVTYVRFMDDWIILSPNRGRLRRAVATMNRVLSSLGLEQHPDKTFIGRVERGFDFLGVLFNRQGCRVSERAVTQLAARGSRLYKRGASQKRSGGYLRRWVG
jgi:retron-type reverse transcriptase